VGGCLKRSNITTMPVFWTNQGVDHAAVIDLQARMREPTWASSVLLMQGHSQERQQSLTSKLFSGLIGADVEVASNTAGTPDSVATLSSQCGCCEPMGDWLQRLEDLFWARLERRIARFESVVIAAAHTLDALVIQSGIASTPLLRERYHFQGSIVI
jgi:hypothetical protein